MMCGLLLFPQRKQSCRCTSVPVHKQNVRSMCHYVSVLQSKSVQVMVGYSDEFGNHCTRPILHCYFIRKTKQVHREANYTEMYHVRNGIKCICAEYSTEWHIRLMDLDTILMQIKQIRLTTGNKMSSHVRIRVQGLGSIYSSGSDGCYLYKKFSALCPKEWKVMCHSTISLF